MKKKICLSAVPIAATLLNIVSCSSDAPVPMPNSEVEESATSWCRSENEAVAIAADAISMLDDQTASRSAIRRVDSSNVRLMRSIAKGRSAIDSLYYVVNFADSAGFAVVAAPRSCEPLLAVTESGSYDPDLGTDNPGLELFMDAAAVYAANHPPMLPIDSLRPVFPCGGELMYKIIRDTIANVKIAPRIKVRWGQEGVYGKYCPNGVSGCSNTAAAMCMTYFRYPGVLNLTYPERSSNSVTLNWSNINMHSVGNYDVCGTETHNSISALLRELGHRAHSTYYDTEETATNNDNLISALKQIGYSIGDIKDYSAYWIDKALDEDALIFTSGSVKGAKSGHLWVIDGVNCLKVHVKEATRENELSDWVVVNDHGVTETHYNHINWGWDGMNNGYFNDGVFNTANAISYDITYGNIWTDNYTTNLKVFTIKK